jgi:hypothetical protein
MIYALAASRCRPTHWYFVTATPLPINSIWTQWTKLRPKRIAQLAVYQPVAAFTRGRLTAFCPQKCNFKFFL